MRPVVLLLLVSLLTGCAPRLAADRPWGAEQDAGQTAAAEPAIRGLLGLLLGQPGLRIEDVTSLPFWAEGWIRDPETLRQAMVPEAGPGYDAGRLQLALRLYPIEDLAAFDPAAWAWLQKADPALLADLRLAVVGLTLPGSEPDEPGSVERMLLLMRRIEGQWRVAGLLEAHYDGGEDID